MRDEGNYERMAQAEVDQIRKQAIANCDCPQDAPEPVPACTGMAETLKTALRPETPDLMDQMRTRRRTRKSAWRKR